MRRGRRRGATRRNDRADRTHHFAVAGDAQAISFAGPNGELLAAYAAAASPKGAVLLVHENRGLTPHFFDLAGRFAADGYSRCVWTCCRARGYRRADRSGRRPAALSAAPVEQLLADLGAGIDELQSRVPMPTSASSASASAAA